MEILAPLDVHALAAWARIVVGLVWLLFGVVFKLLRALPRHERIVARILGDAVAPVLTRLLGLGEGMVGLWMLSGHFLPWCALLQTVLIVAMNTIELRRARDLLLAPLPMLLGNALLLGAAWFGALAS